MSPRQSESLCGDPGDNRAARAQGTSRGGRVGFSRAQHPTPDARAVALRRLDAVTSSPGFHSAWGPGDKSPGERRSRHNFSPARQPLAKPARSRARSRPTTRTLRGAWAGRAGRGRAQPAGRLRVPGSRPRPQGLHRQATPPLGHAPQPSPASARCSRDSGCGALVRTGFLGEGGGAAERKFPPKLELGHSGGHLALGSSAPHPRHA